jgi:lysophospholipase L1-like esterase
MRVWIFHLVFLFTFIVLNTAELNAQKRVVILGSSTAAGNGSSSYANSWVGRVAAYYNKNTTDGADTIFTNLAVSGYATYNEMPDNFVPPPGRPSPDLNANVTKALSYNPDVVIINLPSNDMAFGYSKKEFMDNLRLMYNTIISAPGGPKCYITTTQPRTLSVELRDSLRTLVDSVRNNFGNYAIDFYTDLVTTDGTNDIAPAVSAGDGIHINDLGHSYVAQRVIARNIFSLAIILPLKLTAFNARAQNHTTLLEWKTEQEEPNTSFDIQRSRDGSRFENLYTMAGRGLPTPNTYSWTDQQPAEGNNFYRLRIVENGQTTYSRVLNVINKPAEIAIDKLYKDNAGSNLVTIIHVQRSQSLTITIINMSGAAVFRQTQYISAPYKTLNIPIDKLATGQYYLNIMNAEADAATMGFVK